MRPPQHPFVFFQQTCLTFTTLQGSNPCPTEREKENHRLKSDFSWDMLVPGREVLILKGTEWFPGVWSFYCFPRDVRSINRFQRNMQRRKMNLNVSHTKKQRANVSLKRHEKAVLIINTTA